MKNKVGVILIILVILSLLVTFYILNPFILGIIVVIAVSIFLFVNRIKKGMEEWDEIFEVHDNKIEVQYSEIFDSKKEQSIKSVLAVGEIVKPTNSTKVKVLSFKNDEYVDGEYLVKKYVATVEYIKEPNVIQNNNSTYIENQFNAGRDNNITTGNISTNNVDYSIDQSQIVEMSNYVDEHNELSDIEKDIMLHLLSKLKENKVDDVDNKSVCIKVLRKIQEVCSDSQSIFNIAAIIINILNF